MRKRIERAIYRNSGEGDFYVVSYCKEKKSTQNLAKFNNIEDARSFRDSELRFAKYGKGIQKSGSSYVASILYKTVKGLVKTIYVGSYPSPEEAREERAKFIENLK